MAQVAPYGSHHNGTYGCDKFGSVPRSQVGSSITSRGNTDESYSSSRTQQIFSRFPSRWKHCLPGVCLPSPKGDCSHLVGGLHRVHGALCLFRPLSDPSKESRRFLDHYHGAFEEFDHSRRLSGTRLQYLFFSLLNPVVQVWLKWLIGGFRPHFYAVCKPNVTQFSQPSGTQFANYMYDRSVCTGDKKAVNDALESFPSGHATAAFAGLIFLSLYFNAQLKVMSAHNPAYWKMILFFIPILGAVLIAGALTIDKCETSRLRFRDAEIDKLFNSPPPLGRHRGRHNRNCMCHRCLSPNLRLGLGLPVQPPSTPTHNVALTSHALLFRILIHTFVLLPTPGRAALS